MATLLFILDTNRYPLTYPYIPTWSTAQTLPMRKTQPKYNAS